MKTLSCTQLMIFAAVSASLAFVYEVRAQSPDYSRNFIIETIVRKAGIKDTAAVNALTASDAVRTVSYYDGLGRPQQTIGIGASSGGLHDIILHREYDGYMRESRRYLPYADTASSSFSFRSLARPSTIDYYASGAAGCGTDSFPYSETVFENSLLDRILEQGAPGMEWQPYDASLPGSGHTVVSEYGTCSETGADMVWRWELVTASAHYTSGIATSGTYPSGSLTRRTYRNEDCGDGRAGSVDVYVDYEGRTILERRWIADALESLDTYYVYDLLGRLRYVLTPLFMKWLPINRPVYDDSERMADYAYLYRYDAHGDCVWKKLPGCKPQRIMYDRHHRPVFFEDGNLADEGKCTVCWYDGLGRPAVKAVCSSGIFLSTSSAEFTATMSPSRQDSESSGGYVLSPAPRPGAKIVEVTFYDDYRFIDSAPEKVANMLKASNYQIIATPRVPIDIGDRNMSGGEYLDRGIGSIKFPPRDSIVRPQISPYTDEYDRYGFGRVTGGIRTAPDSAMCPMWYSIYYNDRGLAVQSHTQNHLGGWNREYDSYSFSGKPLGRTLNFITDSIYSPKAVSEIYSYTYDNMDRPLKITHRFNNGQKVTLRDYSYDALGRLISDDRNGCADLATAYSYNIRSWLKSQGNNVFRETLHYDDVLDTNAVPKFSGLVSSEQWRRDTSETVRRDYLYDGAARLINADMMRNGDADSRSGIAYSYDSMCNITSIDDVASDGGTSVLSMTYEGNRLSSAIRDGRSTAVASNGIGQYAYDSNGNMTRDMNSGITSMSYDRLNLPESVTVSRDSVTTVSHYIHDSDGSKLRVASESSDGFRSVTDYNDNIVYRDSSLFRVMIDGGYIESGQYRFFVTDRLGSVRAVTDAAGNVLQRLDYTPYGREIAVAETDGTRPHGGTGIDSQTSAVQPYRFNGKETQQQTAGITRLDYGARLYHPQTARWSSPDPLAEKYYSTSPYAFCSGNPVNFIDPDGKDFRKIVRGNTITITATYYYKRDNNSKESLQQAISFWEKRTNDVFISASGKKYFIRYKLTPIAVDNLNNFSQSNTYMVGDIDSNKDAGITFNRRKIIVRNDYSLTLPYDTSKNSTTGAHEIGHTLGMEHKEQGIMSRTQDENRNDIVSQENINEMMSSEAGSFDIISKIVLFYNSIIQK